MERDGRGFVDVSFSCTDGTSTRMTNSDSHLNHWLKTIYCQYGFDEFIAREQGGYGLINFQTKCCGQNNFVYSNSNWNGWNNGKQICKPGYKMVGLETQEQGRYGIINYNVECQNGF